jgi:hypothetical protein
VRRIALRSHDDEVVVHDVEALQALPFSHELLFCGSVMNEDYIGIAPPTDIRCLAGAHRDDLHPDTLSLRELRKQIAEQSRLLGGCCRGHGDGTLLSLNANKRTEEGENNCCNFHSNALWL